MASSRNLTERVLHMRDEAFASLGDPDLADGVVAGSAPGITITSVEDIGSGATARTVRGTIRVSNYLTPQQEVNLDGDALRRGVGDAGGTGVAPALRVRRAARGRPAAADRRRALRLPPARARRPARLRRTGWCTATGCSGARGEAGGGSTEDLRLRGFMPCAMDWWGMSFSDLGNVVTILADMSNFPSLADRAQQGFLNMLFLARAMAHPDGFASLPAFQDPTGAPLLRPGSVVYAGNSQGAIMGGALTALAPDFTRAVLGVAGMNYSTLLNRSVDWEGLYAEVAYAAYPSGLEQQLVFGLIQMVWDRAETNGYANQMTTAPLPNTPPHRVLLQAAYSDHQVANVTAEVEARTWGPARAARLRAREPALVRRPVLRAGRGVVRSGVGRRVGARLLVLARSGAWRCRRTATCRPRWARTRTTILARRTGRRTRRRTGCARASSSTCAVRASARRRPPVERTDLMVGSSFLPALPPARWRSTQAPSASASCPPACKRRLRRVGASPADGCRRQAVAPAVPFMSATGQHTSQRSSPR